MKLACGVVAHEAKRSPLWPQWAVVGPPSAAFVRTLQCATLGAVRSLSTISHAYVQMTHATRPRAPWPTVDTGSTADHLSHGAVRGGSRTVPQRIGVNRIYCSVVRVGCVSGLTPRTRIRPVIRYVLFLEKTEILVSALVFRDYHCSCGNSASGRKFHNVARFDTRQHVTTLPVAVLVHATHSQHTSRPVLHATHLLRCVLCGSAHMVLGILSKMTGSSATHFSHE